MIALLKPSVKKPILGYGLGVTPQRKCYEKVSKHLNKINYNSHNQYLGYLFNSWSYWVFSIIWVPIISF